MLTRSFDTTFDLAVCRRLVTAGCAFQGRTPTNALEAVRARGRSLGDILVVHVGYNEGSVGYARGMRRIIRAAQAQGARGVVWVTLREADPVYRPTNGAIRREARRWRSVEVADWEALSRGRPWFREDGLHLERGRGERARAADPRASPEPSATLPSTSDPFYSRMRSAVSRRRARRSMARCRSTSSASASAITASSS